MKRKGKKREEKGGKEVWKSGVYCLGSSVLQEKKRESEKGWLREARAYRIFSIRRESASYKNPGYTDSYKVEVVRAPKFFGFCASGLDKPEKTR